MKWSDIKYGHDGKSLGVDHQLDQGQPEGHARLQVRASPARHQDRRLTAISIRSKKRAPEGARPLLSPVSRELDFGLFDAYRGADPLRRRFRMAQPPFAGPAANDGPHRHGRPGVGRAWSWSTCLLSPVSPAIPSVIFSRTIDFRPRLDGRHAVLPAVRRRAARRPGRDATLEWTIAVITICGVVIVDRPGRRRAWLTASLFGFDGPARSGACCSAR